MIKIVGDTHPGRVRDHNEDAILVDEGRGLAVVADGMGGHASGEVASQITIDTFAGQSVLGALAATLLDAHRRIVERALAQPESKGMGATVVVAQADAHSYRISWVGDSRVYHWRRGAGLQQISRDHSYLEWLLAKGEISEAEARTHPQRNVVTQALGANEPEPEPDSRTETWQPGDRLLLCSDGLNDELEDAQIAAILAASADGDTAVAALIDAAVKHGGRDNVSVVVLENASTETTERRPAAVAAPALWPTVWPVLLGVAAALAIGALFYLFYLR